MRDKSGRIVYWACTALLVLFCVGKAWTCERYRQRLLDSEKSLATANRRITEQDAELSRVKTRAFDCETEAQSMRNALSKAGDDMDRAQRDLDLSGKALEAANAGLVSAKQQLDTDKEVMNEQTRTIVALMDYVHAHGLVGKERRGPEQ